MLSTSTQPALTSTKTRQTHWQPYLVGIILLPVLYVMLIHKVGSYPILIWDEARLAVNAAEMDQNSKWLVTYFEGKPEMWNTKPPLIIWLEVLSLRLFGYSETAFRLPTMMASVFTAVLIYLFSYRWLKSLWGAVFAVLIMITATGYNDHHTARTGDYDTVLTLWVMVAALAFFRYLEREKRSDFVWVTIALILAALTKGIAGLFWPPAFLLYAIYRRRLLWLLRRWEVYAGAMTATVVILGYYFAREYYNPGYIAAVQENELGGRMLATLNEHLHPWNWFLVNMYNGKFMPWLVILPFSLFLLCRYPFLPVQRHFAVFGGFIVVLQFVIISSASTKLAWYDMPLYPIASMIIGVSLGILMKNIVDWQYAQSGVAAAASAAVLMFLSLFTGPILRMYNKVDEIYGYRHYDPTLAYGYHTKAMVAQMPQIKVYSMFSGLDYNPSMLYYSMAAHARYNHTVSVKYNQQAKEYKTGDIVVVCGEQDKAHITELFNTIPLIQEESCVTLLLQQPTTK